LNYTRVPTRGNRSTSRRVRKRPIFSVNLVA